VAGCPDPRADRARFGYMPEERGLYPRMRVRDQLTYLGQLCGRRPRDVVRSVDTWLERVGLAERAEDRLDALSHGNQQRVQLIAALVGEPDLLVLDEPFSGLDPMAMEAMAGLLSGLAADGATVLFSSHQLDLVQDLCQDVVIIEHGRIVLAGELAELRAKVPERFVDIRYRGPAPDWSGLSAVTIVEAGDGQVRLRVGGDTDVAAVLAAVRDRADLVSFSYQPPTLSELFRQAVTV
jgi:ABC-2 type transport system ATP-binding protein